MENKKIHETDFNDDRLVADIIEQTGTKRTRASSRLMKLKEANEDESSDFGVGPSDGVNKNKADTSKHVPVKCRRTSEKDNAKSLVLETHSSPRIFYNSISTLKPNKKACLEHIGFGNFVEFKINGIPSKLGLYVVDKFDAKKMEMKLAEGALKITKNLISEMLGIRNKGIDIMVEEGNRNEEMGFFRKLNKHINSVIKEKTRFEKTLDAAEYMFLGKLEGFFKRYVDALKYQGCRKEGSGNANISYANKAADAQADGQNKEGDNNILGDIGMDQGTVVDNICVTTLRDEHADIDMNQEDDVDATIERRKWFDMSDIPSFSLGVTQDLALLDEDFVTPEANTHEPNLASEISNPLPFRPIPLRVYPPGTAVGRLRRDKDKRPVMISEVRKSPFIGRVVDDDGSLNATEKRLTKYLFEVVTLFETISGKQLTRIQMQTLAQREYVDNNILDTWGSVLNHMEVYRCKESPFRMFLPTFVVNYTVYNNLLGREGRFPSSMGYVVNAIKNNGKCELLKDIDVNEKIVRKKVKKKIGTCDNIKVAAMLQKDFGQYLMLKNHSKARNFIGSEIEVGEFDSQTNNMEIEAGIFVMRHMETCMGMGMDELNCCLAGNTRKLKKQLLFLRKKYSAKILLSECNIVTETVVQNASEFGNKPTKVPSIGI
nr:ulp1 protease family, C-terminal catalytic domain-containing protein [Tanacetum cinerariifolium]